MSVTFQPEPTERGDGTYDMHDGAPQLNVSNANGYLLLERLGLPIDNWGSISAEDFLGRALVGNVGRDDSGVTAVEDRRPGLLTVVECGTRPDYFADCLTALVEVARAAQDLGVPVQWA